jgi:hypothetical protein
VQQVSNLANSGPEGPAWLLGASWSTAANDAAISKFFNTVHEFVSASKTDAGALSLLLGAAPRIADLHGEATRSLLHLAVLGDRCESF